MSNYIILPVLVDQEHRYQSYEGKTPIGGSYLTVEGCKKMLDFRAYCKGLPEPTFTVMQSPMDEE